MPRSAARAQGRPGERPISPDVKTVLVADDEDFLRLLVRQVLDRYRILEAQAGTEALSMARDLSPDLIVLDWMMPGMDGPAVLEALRADEDTRGIPVVMVSGRVSSEDEARVLELGASACLRKPFSPRKLRDCVEGLLKDD